MDGHSIGAAPVSLRGALVSQARLFGPAGVLRAGDGEAGQGGSESADLGRECAAAGGKLSIDFVIPGDPKGKGRARSRIAKAKDGRQFVTHYTPSGTVEYENLVRMAAHEAMNGRAPTGFPCRVTVIACCSVPASWSKKKQQKAHLGEVFPTGKPDLDNVSKAVLDGMNRIVFTDDKLVCSLTVTKHYSATPRVEVMVRELDGETA